LWSDLAAVLGCFAVAALFTFAAVRPAGPATQPQTRSGAAGGCAGSLALHTVAGVVCAHGDDTAFASGDGATGDLVPRAIPCHGHGHSGNRIAIYYAYLAGHPNRIRQVRRQLRRAIEVANDAIYRSARQQDGRRSLRVLTTKRCRPVVRALQLPRTARDSFARTIAAASAAGLHAANRKYVLFADTDALCGIATLMYDDRPGPDNPNNAGPSWARVDRGCWNGAIAAHEIMHMLGAVQPGAPHYDDTGHCTDDRDLMCYQNPGGKRVRIRCRSYLDEDRLDCAKDDYFNLAPRAGSYLARHWNTARSSFLYGGGPAKPTPPRAVSSPHATMTTLSSARLSWAAPARSRVTGYQVLKNGSPVWQGSATHWDDHAAHPGAGNYRIRAVNEAGPGPWSAALDAVLPKPPAPTGLTATSSTSVAWTADATLVQGFLFYGLRNDGTAHYLNTLPADARAASDSTPSWLRSWHRYRVCAYNSTGTACRDQAST
jgi:hypothetical protein